MSITHAGATIQGLAGELQFGEWEQQVVFTSTFGNAGASSLDGAPTTRDFSVEIMVYGNFANGAAVNAYIAAANRRIGIVGSVVDSGLQAQTIANCRFEGATKKEGPLPGGPDGGWFAICNFKWKQLSP